MVPMTTFYNVTSLLCVSIDPHSGRGRGWSFYVWAWLPKQENRPSYFNNNVTMMSL